MGPFDLFQKKDSKALPAQPLKARKHVVVSTEPQKTVRSFPTASNDRLVPLRKVGKTTAIRKHHATSRSPNPRKRTTSEQPRLKSDSEEGTTDDETTESRAKRLRLSTEPMENDSSRRIRAAEAFDEGGDIQTPRVHAADIDAMDKQVKFQPAFPQYPDYKHVSLQYPSASQKEK